MGIRFSTKILIALAVIFAQIWFYSLGRMGDGLFPFWVPLVATIFYALVSRSHKLAFIVGFLSFMTFPFGVFWFYYVKGLAQLPDPKGWLAITAWSSLFGLIGLLTVKFSKSVSTSRFRTSN